MGKIPGLDLTQNEAATPKLGGDIRPLIPKLGLRNYWYPAIVEREVGWRKPVKVTVLGEELCLFRGGTGHVAAIQDVCPHRGARLSEGAYHYRGTVACPYHGRVFDESAQGEHPLFVGNGFGDDVAESNYVRRSPTHDVYANGWKWPKTNHRRLWTWLTRPLADRARRNIPPPRSARWCAGHHLPGMFRAEFGLDLYTRMCVPVEEHLTRVWYYHCTRPRNPWRRLWDRIAYATLRRWIIEYDFSRQDEAVMLHQRYDTRRGSRARTPRSSSGAGSW